MIKSTAAAGIILITSLVLSFSAGALDIKIQNAIDQGIITLPEGEIVQVGINDGSIEFIDVDADEGIVVFGVIYYEDEELEEESTPLPCPLKV
jgi:hypothetical protein